MKLRNHPRREHVFALAVLATGNTLLYYDYWLGNKVFSGKDFLTAFYPLLNFQTDCLQGNSWALWNPFMNFGYPYVEHYVNSTFFPTHLLMGLITGSSLMLIQRELLLWILIGGFGMYLCVREFGLKSATGILAGISFMGCGQIIALPQWSTLVYNAACFPYLILGYHRAKRMGIAFSPLSIAFLTFTIFGGYIVTTVLGIYLFAGYVIIDAAMSRKPAFALRYLGLTLSLSVVLTLPKLLPLYANMGAGPRLATTPSAGAPLDSFNIITPYNFLSLLLPVKYYFSLFLGTVGILALLHAILKRTIRLTPLLLISLLSGWLLLADSSGNPSLLRDIASFLPFMRLVRNDWLSWFLPTIFAILFLARPIEDFLSDNDHRNRYIAGVIYATLLSLAFFTAYNKSLYGGAYAVHLGIAAALLFFPTFRRPLVPGVATLVLLLLELTLVFQRVNIDVPLVRQGDRVQFTIVDQLSVSRSLLEDNDIRSVNGEQFAMDVTALDDRLRPTIDEARQQPVLISGLHGMPFVGYSQVQYSMFIDDMNRKRFSGWWYNTQERFDFITIKNSPLLAQMEGRPLYGFFRLSGEKVPAEFWFERITCSLISLRVNAPEAGAVIINQMYDDRWNLQVDNAPGRIERANDYFMGVLVQPGNHTLVFTFHDRLFTTGAVVSGLTLIGLLGWAVQGRRRTVPED